MSLVLFSEGDIFYTFYDNQFHIYKLLKLEYDTGIFHVLRYKPVRKLPDSLDQLEVYIYHSPIVGSGFDAPKLLFKSELSTEDLLGYREYLKQIKKID